MLNIFKINTTESLPKKQLSKKTPMMESILVKLLAAILDLLKEDFVDNSWLLINVVKFARATKK